MVVCCQLDSPIVSIRLTQLTRSKISVQSYWSLSCTWIRLYSPYALPQPMLWRFLGDFLKLYGFHSCSRLRSHRQGIAGSRDWIERMHNVGELEYILRTAEKEIANKSPRTFQRHFWGAWSTSVNFALQSRFLWDGDWCFVVRCGALDPFWQMWGRRRARCALTACFCFYSVLLSFRQRHHRLCRYCAVDLGMSPGSP
jgi:hypothetical protein